MELKCPKCKSVKIFVKDSLASPLTKREVDERVNPKFYVCVKCFHKFNVG